MTKTQKNGGTQELPWWYRQEPQKFMSSPDVEMMTCEEIGSYFLLLQKAWLLGENCTLPNDPIRLARLSRIDRVSDLVLSKFEVDKDGRLFNPRLSMEWKQALKRSKDGKNAIGVRWEKQIRGNNDRNTAVSPPKYDSDTRTEQKTTVEKTRTKTVINHAASSESEAVSSASTSTPTAHGAAAVRVSEKLAAILGRQDLKPATFQAWAEQAEGLITNHGEQTVLGVMEFAFDGVDGFWRGRIYAMKNFVKCFKTILKQAQQNKSAEKKRSQDPLAQRAASIATGHDFSAIAKGDL